MKEGEDHPEVHAFTKQVCLGNREAMICCDFFYRYAHGIDDLLDTMEDGRPTMSKEKILEIFITAGMLYNCPFFKQHSVSLFPVVVTITNAYADSVAWESDPKESRRIMADVMRTCGDEFFLMVAMLCGGWQHIRALSGAIRERDYDLQHTQPDDFH